ncbi:hypothetical protein, unlikely [Trypanosoma brucei gambiense DAL972]|uniref:Uncharacterized protein n=1 Tax=Trypanosoma brucei gambiense (strain MHOM/CI/86/DAL972) TaxID=679716 RepID=D0A5X4_TRYB9|nr:hypothetical protein, unlikely [Trypanosoma brucei gambiense DAL972]CBH17075.1 hypothetical protein, unlikely [Trypanosoma brucei gambiense DAL972]|eukprot:XP_011779339.1 hypothetical protein, unlikely [Trypanosoma brucei gambiense DAL972]
MFFRSFTFFLCCRSAPSLFSMCRVCLCGIESSLDERYCYCAMLLLHYLFFRRFSLFFYSLSFRSTPPSGAHVPSRMRRIISDACDLFPFGNKGCPEAAEEGA